MDRSRALVLFSFALAGLAVGCTAAKPPIDPRSQLRFGVEMAQRGLWNEALFRFQVARDRAPDDPRANNNLAVALEAVGRFDEALAAYREAIRLDPANRQLKQNYSRFVEFYQGFRPPAPAGSAPAATPVPPPAAP